MALALARPVHIGMIMNGREQMKQARAKVLGRERHPANNGRGRTNRYALEPTLIELGVDSRVAFWAQYSKDSLGEREDAQAYWSLLPSRRRSSLKASIAELAVKGCGRGPLPLP